MLRRHWWKVLLVYLTLYLLYFGYRSLSPKKQVVSQQKALVRNVELARWEPLKKMFHPEFEDAWGLGKDAGVGALENLRGQFLLLGINGDGASWEMDDSTATLTVNLTIKGKGSALAPTIIERANAVTSPYVFTWEKVGRGASGWKLRSVTNEGLTLSPADLGNF